MASLPVSAISLRTHTSACSLPIFFRARWACISTAPRRSWRTMPCDAGQTSLRRSTRSLACWADGSLNGGSWCRSRKRISTARSTFPCCRTSKKPSTGVPIILHTKAGIIFRPKNHLVHGMRLQSQHDKGVWPPAGCLENFSRRGCCHWFQMHPIPQAFNPPGEPIDGELPPPFVEIIGSQFTVHFIAGEHVKNTTHNGVRHGNDGPLLPPADGEALI